MGWDRSPLGRTRERLLDVLLFGGIAGLLIVAVLASQSGSPFVGSGSSWFQPIPGSYAADQPGYVPESPEALAEEGPSNIIAAVADWVQREVVSGVLPDLFDALVAPVTGSDEASGVGGDGRADPTGPEPSSAPPTPATTSTASPTPVSTQTPTATGVQEPPDTETSSPPPNDSEPPVSESPAPSDSEPPATDSPSPTEPPATESPSPTDSEPPATESPSPTEAPASPSPDDDCSKGEDKCCKKNDDCPEKH